jgi:diguanylate cyclase (GGDEF)-like protein/putative nucleotidyltransferase with HDIG domain
MNAKAKAFIFAVALLGLAVLHASAAEWRPDDRLRFMFFLLVSVLGSGLKVLLPGINGTVSTNFLFILVGVVELSLGETMAIAVASILAQSFVGVKEKFQAVKVIFNVTCIALSSWLAYRTFHSGWLTVAGGQFPVKLALSTCAYFFANTGMVSVVISLVETKSVVRMWRETYIWSLLPYLMGAGAVGIVHIINVNLGWQASVMVLPGVYLAYRSYATYQEKLKAEQREVEAQKLHADEMASLHLRAIEALALAIQAKDNTTHDHLHRVQMYAIEVGAALQLPPDDMEALRAASLLHDIGKLAVPEHIISKPGRLTPEEFEKIKIHPLVGAEILERIKFPYPVVPIVRAHHERWDGTGYPLGLVGEQIPLGARILAAVDCLDALASDRQYRRALPLDEAMAFVSAESGRSFDPRIVDVLKQVYRDIDRKAKTTQFETARLSTDLLIRNNAAPGAGYEHASQAIADSPRADEFLASIAAARQEAQVLYEVAQDLGNSLSLEETLSVVAGRLHRIIPFDAIAVWILERTEVNGKSEAKLVPSHVFGDDHRTLSAIEIPMGHGVSGWVAETRQPIINGDPQLETSYLADMGTTSYLPPITVRAALGVPLEGSANVIGCLTLYRREKESFTRDNLRVLLAVCSKLGVALENSLRFREAADSATTDYLTGLPNARSLFLQLETQIAKSKTEGQPLAVFVTDLNGFKDVNDRFGHLEGNRLLRTLAKSIRTHCRDLDYVARMGGDEFVVILPGVRGELIEELAGRFRKATVEAGREVTGLDILSLSIGIAEAPVDGTTAEELLAIADKRMYAAKRAFKSGKVREMKPVANAFA